MRIFQALCILGIVFFFMFKPAKALFHPLETTNRDLGYDPPGDYLFSLQADDPSPTDPLPGNVNPDVRLNPGKAPWKVGAK
jgi:hypothetical protein